MTELRIALAQTRQTADRRDNRRAHPGGHGPAGSRTCASFASREAQTCGYRVDIAEPTGTVPVAWLEEVHEEVAGVVPASAWPASLGTEVRSESGKPYNSALVIADGGRILGAHHKTCSRRWTRSAYEPGTGPHTFSLFGVTGAWSSALRDCASPGPRPSARRGAQVVFHPQNNTTAQTTGRSPCTTP